MKKLSTINFSLADYIKRGGYKEYPFANKTYEELLFFIFRQLTPGMIVAIDGPTNSGKSYMAKSLAEMCDKNGLPSSLLPLDFFLTDRDTRRKLYDKAARGAMDAANYSQYGWEQERYSQVLLKARQSFASGSKNLTISNVYDRQSGQKQGSETLKIHNGGVIITEGVGIHAYHENAVDFKIRVDVNSDKVLLCRILDREAQKPKNLQLDAEYLKWRYQTLDGPHTAYLRSLSPPADIVIDCTDFSAKRIYTQTLM